ncbi:eCIS core domain-containing protein [Paenibacillus soyae]|uniref:DUF4157 domain-containing protein n=1 Tax=Paenibacillus soyae TaxID=2969249 RepID=A0A9X2MWE8_9BACL|nr:DUF4157 domain-containing protein [Paenibacillus soyae]MCR2807076.1 DUF4157 domain-containing protein [Paenibacillus soyae]
MFDRSRKPSDAKRSGIQRKVSGKTDAPSRQTAATGTANQLLQLQKSIGNRAVAQLLTGDKAASAASAPRPGTNGLPDTLRTGVEQLSGMDLNDVKVHYNSDKPKALNALAYAQGNEIHLGPGQEKHLPHEAWHVVQQRQGRVKPTVQLKAAAIQEEELERETEEEPVQLKAAAIQEEEELEQESDGIVQLKAMINDDEGLEREADEMGSRALQLGEGASDDISSVQPERIGSATKADAAVQRRVKPYDTNFSDPSVVAKYKDQMKQLVDFINQRVLQARKDAVAWQTYVATNNKHLALWYQSASSFVQNPVNEPKLIHARFGYAIETLACAGLAGSHGGLHIDLQVASGHTRPDIVVSDGVQELAWIDITSEKSKKHILGKDGSGWRRRPFVYEVLYDQLELKELLAATNDNFYNEYGAFVADEHQIEYDETERIRNEKRDEFIEFRDSKGWETSTGNATNKKGETRDFLFSMTGSEDLYVEDYHSNLKQTKGALHYFGLNAGPFGFKGAKEKEESSAAKEYVRRLAEPEIEQRKNTLAATKNMELAVFFRQYENHFLAAQLFNDEAEMITPDRDLVKTGMALKAAIMDFIGMEKLYLFAKTMLADEPRVKLLLQNAEMVRSRFLGELDFEKIMAWRSQVNQLYQQATLLRKIQPAQRQFIQYADKKYNFFSRPREVSDILTEFSKDLPNEAVIEAAGRWMAGNP